MLLLKTLYLLNFAIKLFLEKKLLALKIDISNIDPPDHRHIQKKHGVYRISTYFS